MYTTIGEGDLWREPRTRTFAEKYNLVTSDFKFEELEAEDSQIAHITGSFPMKLTSFEGKYYL